jgi:hypothetical protein
MENIYYVYCLLDPTNYYLPFYIGKGKNKRAQSHLNHTDRNNNIYKENTIKKIREAGMEPTIMYWKSDLTEDLAYDLEENLIRLFGRKVVDESGILTNICEDARPPNQKGKKYTDPYSQERRDKISKANKGKNPWNLGIPLTAETKDKISNSRKGSSSWFKGKFHSDESKQKMSEAKKDKCFGKNNNMFGKKHKPESIQKMKDNKTSATGENNRFHSSRLTEEDKKKRSHPYTYKIISPDNIEYITNNILEFCRMHSLDVTTMRNNAKENIGRKHKKGWQAFIIAGNIVRRKGR